MMKLSVILPWHDNGDPWRQKSWNWVCNRYHGLLPEAEIIYGDGGAYNAREESFNRSTARNALIEQSTGEVLLIADADVVFHRPHIESAIARLLGGAPWVIPYSEDRYYNLTADETALVWRSDCGAGVPEPNDPRQWDHKLTSWAGLLLVPRASFDAVGGYDERFQGWGYEDNAFRAALDRRVGSHRRVDGYVLHLWHPAPEEACFGQPNINANRELYRRYEAGLLP